LTLPVKKSNSSNETPNVMTVGVEKRVAKPGILKLDAVDAVDAVDALHPHLLKLIQYLLKLDAVHPVTTKTGCSASSHCYSM
jgi:hypothetical protein